MKFFYEVRYIKKYDYQWHIASSITLNDGFDTPEEAQLKACEKAFEIREATIEKNNIS